MKFSAVALKTRQSQLNRATIIRLIDAIIRSQRKIKYQRRIEGWRKGMTTAERNDGRCVKRAKTTNRTDGAKEEGSGGLGNSLYQFRPSVWNRYLRQRFSWRTTTLTWGESHNESIQSVSVELKHSLHVPTNSYPDWVFPIKQETDSLRPDAIPPYPPIHDGSDQITHPDWMR